MPYPYPISQPRNDKSDLLVSVTLILMLAIILQSNQSANNIYLGILQSWLIKSGYFLWCLWLSNIRHSVYWARSKVANICSIFRLTQHFVFCHNKLKVPKNLYFHTIIVREMSNMKTLFLYFLSRRLSVTACPAYPVAGICQRIPCTRDKYGWQLAIFQRNNMGCRHSTST